MDESSPEFDNAVSAFDPANDEERRGAEEKVRELVSTIRAQKVGWAKIKKMGPGRKVDYNFKSFIWQCAEILAQFGIQPLNSQKFEDPNIDHKWQTLAGNVQILAENVFVLAFPGKKVPKEWCSKINEVLTAMRDGKRVEYTLSEKFPAGQDRTALEHIWKVKARPKIRSKGLLERVDGIIKGKPVIRKPRPSKPN